MAYIAATLNPEILKKFPGPVRVGKKKSGSGRVAGTRQGLLVSGNRCHHHHCHHQSHDDDADDDDDENLPRSLQWPTAS